MVWTPKRVQLEALDIFSDSFLLTRLCLIPSSGLEKEHSGPDSRGEGPALVPQNGPEGQGGRGGVEMETSPPLRVARPRHRVGQPLPPSLVP